MASPTPGAALATGAALTSTALRNEIGSQFTLNIKALHVPQTPTVTFNTVKCIIQQNFSPTWSEEQAYGKMDPIATYSHTNRNIKFDFTIYASKNTTAKLMMGQVDQFVKFNYPRYNEAGTALKAPPFFEVSFSGDSYIPKVQGYIKALNINPGSARGVPARDTVEGKLERLFQITFDLTVLHAVQPGWSESGFRMADGSFAYSSAAGKSSADPDNTTVPKQKVLRTDTALNRGNY